MNKNVLLSAVLCGLCLAPFATQANDKVETTYNAQKYMQLCKGKSQGTWVSFATAELFGMVPVSHSFLV